MTWTDRAACAGLEPGMFDTDQRDRWREGQRICTTCPVRAECLAHVLKQEGRRNRWDRAMVYGGLTPMQRVRLSRGQPPGKPEGAESPLPRDPAPAREYLVDTDLAARLAHNRFNAGDRDPETIEAERRYQRDRGRARRKHLAAVS